MADHNGTTSQTLSAVTQAATGVLGSKGPIAQTLSVVTQAATAEASYFSLHDTVQFSDSFDISWDEVFTDTVLLGEVLQAGESQRYTDTVEFSDEITFYFTWEATDTVQLSESLQVSWTTLLAPEGAEFSETITQFFSSTLTDTVNFSDTLTGYWLEELTDTANLSEVLTPQVVASELLTDTLIVADEFMFSGIVETLTDTAQVSEVVTEWAVVDEQLTDTVNFSDTQTSTASSFEELLDTVNLSNQITFDGSVYSEELHETFVVSGDPWAADAGAIAWVMNTETTGLSVYDNFDFTSIAEYNGVLYATSGEGVFALTGDEDITRDVDADIGTGFLDLGTAQTKRLSDVYVGYTGGRLELDVETYDGPQEVYTYVMEERDADAPRNNRAKIGKGLSSRYWRFSLKNVDGADFQVYDLSAVVGISRRRL